jgi:2-polyprenyl-3-methyl-5-hydroxy-6-metoxy-1,4-benzoquinol methylase
MENKIAEYYNGYDEEGRLSRDNSHNIEWITTMHYFKNLIPSNSYIFDACAGTGNYAFELASMKHTVVASDIVHHNVDIMKEKQIQSSSKLQNIFQGDICDVSKYKDETFDVVLCMGAFYHIDAISREKAMNECLRILKNNGLLVISYINNMAVATMRIGKHLENMDEIIAGYENKTFDRLFLHMNPDEIESLVSTYNTKIVKHIATDGLNYAYSSDINSASKENFDKYIKFHLKTCENKYLLGYSLHGLLILQKYKCRN